MAGEEGLISAGAKTLGSFLSNFWNFSNQKELNEQVANLSFQNQSRLLHKSDQLNRAYASDQYSIFRDSLKKANLNPYIMSGAQPAGSGLQAGSGASGSSSPQVDFGDFGFQGALGTKMAIATHQQQLNNMNAEEEYIRAKTKKLQGTDTDEANSRTQLNKSQSALNEAQLGKVASSIGVDEATVKKLEAETLFLGKSDLSKHLGDNPTLADISDYLSKKIPDIAKDVVIGVGSILMGFGFGKKVLGRIFSRALPVLMNSNIEQAIKNILKSKDLFDSKQELSELEQAVVKRFGSDVLK